MSLPKKILFPFVIVYLLLLAVLGQALLLPAPSPQGLQVDPSSLTMSQEGALLRGAGFDQTTQLFLSLDTGNQRLQRTVLPTYGQGGELLRVGNFAYLANHQRGLTILDLTDPLHPRMIGAVALPGLARTVVVANQIAYVGCGDQGLAVVDIGAPTAPRLLTTLPEINTGQGMAVISDRLYITLFKSHVESALAVIDIGQPERPRLLGRIPLQGQPLRVAAVGNRLCIAAGKAGLYILTLDVTGFPRVSALLSLPESALGLASAGQFVYLGSPSGALMVVDLAKEKAQLITSLPLPGDIRQLLVEGGRLYALGVSNGGQIFDLSDPRLPQHTGYFEGPRASMYMAAIGDIVYVIGRNRGVHVLDLSAPAPQQVAGRSSLPGSVLTITLQPGLAYVTTKEGSLHVIDRSDPRNPQVIAALPLHGHCMSLAVAEGTLFAYMPDRGLQIIDISDPRRPRAVALYPHQVRKGNGSLAVIDDLAVLAGDDGKLLFLDISIPEQPKLSTVMHVVDRVNNLVARGDLICATTVAGKLLLIDPATRQLRGSLTLPTQQLSDLTFACRLAVLVSKLDGLFIVDLADPEKPRLLSTTPLTLNPDRVTVRGNTAYVSARQGGVQMLDLADPARPRPGISTPVLNDIAVDGDYLYLAARQAGLLVLPLPQELAISIGTPQQLSFELPAVAVSGHYTLRIDNGRQTISLPGVLRLSAQR